MKNIPLTIQATSNSMAARVVFSSHGEPFYRECSYPTSSGDQYCVVVVDRKTGGVSTSFTFNDNSAMPSGFNPFLGNPDYMFVLVTVGLQSSNLPTGELYDWLIKEGAGAGLKSLEQYYAALGCANWGSACYVLVDIFGENEYGNPFEVATMEDNTILYALELEPVGNGTDTLYTPISLK